jgi:hypothetical protein
VGEFGGRETHSYREDGNKSGAISGRMTTTTAIHMLHNVPAPVRAIRETVRRSAKGIRETGPCNAIAHAEPPSDHSQP